MVLRFHVAAFFILCIFSSGHARPPQDAELPSRIKKLVEDLGDISKQTGVATELLRLGPSILPLLPEVNEKMPASQREGLKKIRATLYEAQIQQELLPRLFTLVKKDVSLSEVLGELRKQTGVEVQDGRSAKESEQKIKLDVKKAPFWKAIDAIAKEADLKVVLDHSQNRVILKDGPFEELAVSYSGMFRVIARRMTAVRSLGGEAQHFCTSVLEINWEPRIQPLILETQPDSLVIEDEKGQSLKPETTEDGGQFSVDKRMAIETTLRMAAPDRSIKTLNVVRGKFMLIGPCKTLDFAVDSLKKIEKNDPKQMITEVKEGVTFRLREFTVEPQLWTVGVVLDYPLEGPVFESFQSWLANNRVYLEKKATKERLEVNGGYDIDQAGHRATINYRFTEENGKELGNPEDWRLVYQTPAMIAKMQVKFEFKDLPLP